MDQETKEIYRTQTLCEIDIKNIKKKLQKIKESE